MNIQFEKEWQPWTGSNKCPNCGRNNIEYNTQVVLTTYPAQSQLRCKDCGHYFGSGINAEWTNKDALDDMWKHDQSILNIPKVGDWPPSQTPGNPPPTTDKTTIYGWICPKCGKVNAPHRDFCDCAGNGCYPNIVYNDGSTGNNPNPFPSITISGTALQSNIVEVLDLKD